MGHPRLVMNFHEIYILYIYKLYIPIIPWFRFQLYSNDWFNSATCDIRSNYIPSSFPQHITIISPHWKLMISIYIGIPLYPHKNSHKKPWYPHRNPRKNFQTSKDWSIQVALSSHSSHTLGFVCDVAALWLQRCPTGLEAVKALLHNVPALLQAAKKWGD